MIHRACHLGAQGCNEALHRQVVPMLSRKFGSLGNVEALLKGWPEQELRENLARMPKAKLKSARKDRSAAVLLPLCLDELRRPSVLLCVRAAHLRNHAGEICLPGGGTEAEDSSSAATALREAREELGLEEHRVTILGDMPETLSAGRIAVTPVVGLLDRAGSTAGELSSFDPKSLRCDEQEVAASFCMPLEHLLKPDTLVWHPITLSRESMPMHVPAFRLSAEQAAELPYFAGQARPPNAPEDEVSVWGLTGFILHSFLSNVLRAPLPKRQSKA
mmetsp:Transcript_23252/g.51025  ORF Transcript_23252/g.51025 Transcript_23252/m.51025 type:complete len:275 (-) Transcript_23252:276-1100(-)